MRSSYRFLPLLLAALWLAACAPRAAHRPIGPAPLAEQSFVREDQLGRAEQAMAAGRLERARDQLAQVPVNGLDFEGRLRYDTLQAEIALAEDRPAEALQLLPRSWQVSEPAFAARIDRVRAQAYFRLNDPVSALRALAERERRLVDPQHIAENHDLIWNGLRSTSLEGLGLQYAQLDPVVQGWLELARISRAVWTDEASLQQSLAAWRARFPGHPGANRVAGTEFGLFALPDGHTLATSPMLRQIAVLLPLTGPYAAAAEAVRDGFLAAALAQPAPRPVIRVYDVGAVNETLLDAYQRAVSEGADFIVGPLRKDGVAALAQFGRPPVPLLALNYLDPGQTAPERFFQIGLAPEDEARRVAEVALGQGLQRAVALVPETEWGTRVLQAFAGRLEELNGRLLDSRGYAGNTSDYSDPIRAMLGINASEERRRALAAVLGSRPEFEPRRRDDVEFIFLGARMEQARQILPQLRFHRATGVPVFATSSVFDGESLSAELNGLRFCDMPWMLGLDEDLRAARDRLRRLFPRRSAEFERLVALGWDAYALVPLLHHRQFVPGALVPGAIGMLALQETGEIRRGLSCAQVSRGGLQPLSAPGE